ncbi:hypothetical protein NPX13_g8118 [Xylaria arbuscula]|uniref:Uncharacterized protein n=1 Tax=Xylaria arbuscula TaxID=114810 RepID=A0A9W8TK49_9PEZI|nr:hypothetical protein NPX13_g8118 [Xylaria arbuscula]
MLQFPSEIHGMIAEQCTQKDIASVARNAINAGADIQHNIQYDVSFYHDNYEPLVLFTPLHIAVWNGNFSSVACLIQNGADLNSQSCSFDLTPLMLALLRYREAIALDLLDHGAALTTSSLGDTPLHLACERNMLDVIKYLGDTPLLCAIDSDYAKTEVITYLCAHGADPTLPIAKFNNTVLHLAASRNLLDITKYLVQNKGMDLNSKDTWGNTPLLSAIYSTCAEKEVISYLYVHGADPTYSTRSGEDITTPLQVTIDSRSWGIAEQLIRDGVDPSEIPIPLAESLANTDMLGTDGLQEFLAFIDSLKNATDIYTDTFDRLASQTDEYCKGAKLLLRKGCINISNRTSRWMSKAMSPSSGSSTTTALLLQYGAQIPDSELGKILHLINQILLCYNKRLEKRITNLCTAGEVVKVNDVELRLWRYALPACVEHCRDWTAFADDMYSPDLGNLGKKKVTNIEKTSDGGGGCAFQAREKVPRKLE